MPTSFREAWHILRDGVVDEEASGTLLRLLLNVGRLRVFAGVDRVSGDPSIVLEAPESLSCGKLLQQSCWGFRALALDEGHAADGCRLLAVKLVASEAEDLFASLGDSIELRLQDATSDRTAFGSVVSEIERWRRFLRKHSGGLDPAGVVGLIGELGIFKAIAVSRGVRVALDAWRGPAGAMRDFEMPDLSIEVKAFSPAAGGKVRISDPLQLEADAARPLLLACQEVSVAGEGGGRLPDYVNECRLLLAGNVRALEQFESLLADAGYLPAHDGLYVQRYMRGGLGVYLVDDAFPRLPAEIIPVGVEDVRYSLSVASLAVFAVDFNAALHQEGPLTGRRENGDES